MFSLIFRFPFNVLWSYKALINSTCNRGLHRIYKHSFFLFFQLIAYHWSFVIYQNICIFIKWKLVKYHTERSQYQFHPVVEIFSFQPEVKGTCISKKIHPGLKFHPGVIFTSPTCNMPLRLKPEKCLDYLTEVGLILTYIGLRLLLKSLNYLAWLVDWFCYKFELDWRNELTRNRCH